MQHKILLVDDDRLILGAIGKGLKLAGYDVYIASSGVEALQQAITNPPDLAILDICIPDLSGIELAQHLLLQDKCLPVVFLTAYSDDETMQEAFNTGYVTYLVKPCSLQQLILTVESVLEKTKEIAELKEQKKHLDKALSQSRDIAIAVGMIMNEFKLEQNQAFEKLRKTARASRKKVALLAAELIQQAEKHERFNLL